MIHMINLGLYPITEGSLNPEVANIYPMTMAIPIKVQAKATILGPTPALVVTLTMNLSMITAGLGQGLDLEIPSMIHMITLE